MSVRSIEAMVNWVEDNIEEDPDLVTMARHVGYSEYYCSAKFHEYVGVSFKEYVFRRKLAQAAKTLISTKETILQIAMRYGFSSNEAFTRAFKKTYGCSPSQFRQTRPEVCTFEKASFT